MILLSLDEYGDFEGLKPETKDAVLVAGLMFDDKGAEGEEAAERVRIRGYYESIIEEIKRSNRIYSKISYPEDLHANLVRNNKNVVREVKIKVQETMGEFLQKGTYRGKALGEERKGAYTLYVILKSDNGKEERIGSGASVYLRDDYAANLYFHMASEVIQRMVFENPTLPSEQSFRLQLATRSSGPIPGQEPIVEQYKRLGYYEKKAGDGDKVYFILTNTSVYTTAIEQYLANGNPNDCIVENCEALKMDYDAKASNQEFLYLSDSICAYLSYNLANIGKSADIWLKEIDRRLLNWLPEEQCLLFAYDKVDVEFAKACEAYRKKQYLEMYSILYDAMQKKGAFYEFYQERWFAYLIQKVAMDKDSRAFEKAVRDFRTLRFSNTYEQGKGRFIADRLKELAAVTREELKRYGKEDVLYYLYEAIIISYSHVGNAAKAEEYYKKARKYAHSVSTEDFLNTRNHVVVLYNDSFRYEQAAEIAGENLKYTRMILDVKNQIDDQIVSNASEEEGKAYSQLGQSLAFLRSPDTEKTFYEAMSKYREKAANYYITESYLLHHYIDVADKEKYRTYSKDYFGGYEDLKEQLIYLYKAGTMAEPLIYLKFGLYVYIKALYLLRADEITEELWDILRDLENFSPEGCQKISGRNGKLFDHPMELIYKYLALLAIKRKDREALEHFMKAGEECLTENSKEGPLLHIISRFAEVQVRKAQGQQDAEGMQEVTELLLRTAPDFFSELQGKTDFESQYAIAAEKLTYTIN